MTLRFSFLLVSEQLSSEMDSSNQMLIDDIVSIKTKIAPKSHVCLFFVTKDLTKLAPKKIDWDLKRNIAKKLEKLERKTQVAIAELISKLCNYTHVNNDSMFYRRTT